MDSAGGCIWWSPAGGSSFIRPGASTILACKPATVAPSRRLGSSFHHSSCHERETVGAPARPWIDRISLL
jgi:hypothetical protein